MPKNADFLQIKRFRERKRLKRNELAEILGVPLTTYGNWENGYRDPSFSVVKKLFEMGATVEELFGVKYISKVSSVVDNETEFVDKVAAAIQVIVTRGKL